MKRKTISRKTKKRKIINQKTKKRKSMKQKYIKQKYIKMMGGTILGIGNDGCVIDSVSCKNPEMDEKNIISKIFKKDININKELQEKLLEIDPNRERFISYQFCDNPNFNNYADITECKGQIKSELNESLIAFMPLLEPLKDPKKMSKIQYRYLKKSMELLRENHISHGDLPGNVMINPIDNLPRIIDWEHANINTDKINLDIDYNAFFNEFKIINV